MFEVQITAASDDERRWAGLLMAGTEPWTTLGISAEQCISVCMQNTNQVFIARHMGERSGMIILQEQGLAGSPYIKSIAVKHEDRNKGVGHQLLKFAEDRYSSTSRFIFLCVSSFNTGAQKFYDDNGYIRVGELKDYIAVGHSELLMQKRLQ